jgi:hypothetical protein
MSEQPRSRYSELLADQALIAAAVNRAAREAVLTHARAGRPVATLRDGKVVWIQPVEILAQFGDKTEK